MNATTVNMISENSQGKAIKKAITYINPNTADSDTAQFIVGLDGLSDNTLTSIQKVATTDIEFSQE